MTHHSNLELSPCRFCSNIPVYERREGYFGEEYFAIVCPCGHTVRDITSLRVKDRWNYLNRKED